MTKLPQNLSGRYQLISQLGSGGMGAVFKAQDLKLKRLVALKIMNPSLAHNQNFRDRFLQEAQSAARLKHPGIVQVYDIVEDGDYLYFVMNFIEGLNLAQHLRSLQDQGHSMPLHEALELVTQVSEALDYAHQNGVLHRDIKPANILLEPVEGEKLPYRPVLTDLGLAKLLAGGLETQVGISMGTPAYMAPEQALGKSVSAQADVYALGVLLYELVTGRLPFPLRNVSDAIHFHMSEPPPLPPALPEAYPKALSQLLVQSLQRDPQDRPLKAAAFSLELVKILDSLVGETPLDTDLPGGRRAAESVDKPVEETSLSAGTSSEPGGSVWKKFLPSPTQPKADSLEIFTSAGTFQTVSLGKEPLSIGRDEDSDIVLDDPKVSRQHARLSFDGENYRLTDLNSTNGTFLGKTRLLPGSLELWQPDKSLRIGDHYLRLVRLKAGQEEKQIRQEGTLVDMKLGIMSEAGGKLGVAVPQANLTVEPGSSVELSFTCLNQGQLEDTFAISVDGLPTGWVPAESGTLILPPYQPKEVVILIQPPRSPASRATRYPFLLRLTSQSNPKEIVENRCALTVLPYLQFTSQLLQVRLQEGKPGRVRVQNQGNVLETFTVNLKDNRDELIFRPGQTTLKIHEGESADASFTIQAKKKQSLGSKKILPFTASVGVEHTPGSLAAPAAIQEHPGEFVSRGSAAGWLIALVAFLFVIVLGGVMFLILIR